MLSSGRRSVNPSIPDHIDWLAPDRRASPKPTTAESLKLAPRHGFRYSADETRSDFTRWFVRNAAALIAFNRIATACWITLFRQSAFVPGDATPASADFMLGEWRPLFSVLPTVPSVEISISNTFLANAWIADPCLVWSAGCIFPLTAATRVERDSSAYACSAASVPQWSRVPTSPPSRA